MIRETRILLAAAACAVALIGCAAKEAKWSAETASKVVYAKYLPLYPGARATDALGSDTWGDAADSHTEGMCVWYQVENYDRAKVLSWYEERLQGAESELLDNGAVTLTMPAPKGESGEDMGVYIDENGFRVFEHTKVGKHKTS